jgi:hypothetical protein
MGFVVGVLLVMLLVGTIGALVFRQSWRRERIERLRDRARLRVIEGQMTMLRTALRINAAEQAARRRMHTVYDNNVFANSTAHEEPEAWR